MDKQSKCYSDYPATREPCPKCKSQYCAEQKRIEIENDVRWQNWITKQLGA